MQSLEGGKLNFKNTADFADMIHTDRSNWRRYRPTGELQGCSKVELEFICMQGV